jgi:hypothetical protein
MWPHGARFTARRGRGDRGAQGGAIGKVGQGAVRWRARASSAELSVARALPPLLREVSKGGAGDVSTWGQGRGCRGALRRALG